MSAPITKAEAARRKGVSAAAITKWSKKHPDAVTDGRIDSDHPAWLEYLSGADEAPTEGSDEEDDELPAPTAHRRRERDSSEDEDGEIDFDRDFDRYADLTLRELIDKHGSKTGLKDWLDARKVIAEIRGKDLKNAELEGQLISRELVKVHVFGAIEAANRRLLADAAKTIAQTLYPMARRGESVEDAEKVVRDIIGKILSPVKATAARVLRDA
jgi:RNA-binding protein YhbY